MQKEIIELVKNNKIDEVRIALEKGFDPNTKDKNKRNLLLLATINRSEAMAALLVTHGADVNMQADNLDSPFLYSGGCGYYAGGRIAQQVRAGLRPWNPSRGRPPPARRPRARTGDGRAEVNHD